MSYFIDLRDFRDMPEGELIGMTKQLKIEPPKTVFTYMISNEPEQFEKMLKEGNAFKYDFDISSILNSIFWFNQYENYFLVKRREILKISFKYGASPYISIYFQKLDPQNKDYVELIFFQFIKQTWLPVGIALRHLTACEQMEILEHMIPSAKEFSIQKRWKLITSIKHYK